MALRIGKAPMGSKPRSRRQDLIRTIPLGTVFPGIFIAIASVQQPNLGDATRCGRIGSSSFWRSSSVR